jgi:hypothetical protein
VSSTDEPVPTRLAVAVGAIIAMLPVPAFAPAAGGGVAAALLPGTRRRHAGLGAGVGLIGGAGYLLGWIALAFVLSGAFPPELPNGDPFGGFATFIFVLDLLGGTAGGVLGGALARRARARGNGDVEPADVRNPD